MLIAAGVTVALLLPVTIAAESRIQTGAAKAALSASAHVNFKIVIPKVLYMNVGSGTDRAVGAETVAIMSNGHNVTLNASVRLHDSEGPAHGSTILSAAARKVIEQDAQCTAVPAAAVPSRSRATRTAGADLSNSGDRQVICTASMP